MFKFNLLEKLVEKVSATFNFFGKKNSSVTKNRAEVSNSTVGSIQQAHSINNDMRSFAGSDDHVSELELKILKELYLAFKETRKYPRLPLKDVHEKLGISDGDYIGPVNDSKFLKIDGNDYVIKEVGIRFMDSFVRNNKPEVDITSLVHSGGPNGQELTGLRLVNNGSGSAIDIRCFLCADGLERVNFANIERLNPNEESRNSLGYRYSDTSFFTQPLKNLRVVFEYKNKDGFKFASGRYLDQKKRADGNYNINNYPLGDHFEE